MVWFSIKHREITFWLEWQSTVIHIRKLSILCLLVFFVILGFCSVFTDYKFLSCLPNLGTTSIKIAFGAGSETCIVSRLRKLEKPVKGFNFTPHTFIWHMKVSCFVFNKPWHLMCNYKTIKEKETIKTSQAL